jgi:hypothetical protein
MLTFVRFLGITLYFLIIYGAAYALVHPFFTP